MFVKVEAADLPCLACSALCCCTALEPQHAATVLSWFMTSQLPLLLLAAFSFWVPQIWHNIINTARQPLQPGYILVSTAARLLLPVYLLCCPLNLLQLTPQPWLAAALLIWVGLQVVVLLLQHYAHPHVILPASWAPVRYNYHRVEVRVQHTRLVQMTNGMLCSGSQAVEA
jgi:hypothetical protein